MSPVGALTHPTVLLVDAHADTREMYALYLAHAGFNTIEASDGVSALKRARHFQPHVIALELMAPRLDGYAVCRQLKVDERTRHIPILAVTSLARPSAQGRAKQVGCVEVLLKPCAPDALLEAIRRTLILAPPSDAMQACANSRTTLMREDAPSLVGADQPQAPRARKGSRG